MHTQRGTMRYSGGHSVRMAPLILFVLVFATLPLCGCAFAGNGSSSQDAQAMEQRVREEDERVLKEGIGRELDSLVSPSAEELKKLFDGNAVTLEELPAASVEQQFELMSHLLRDFSYKVDSVDVRGNEATATVEVTCLDASQAIEKSAKALSEGDELQSNADLYNSTEEADRKALFEHVYDMLYADLDALTNMKTSTVTLEFTKNDNEWLLYKNSLDELLSALWE